MIVGQIITRALNRCGLPVGDYATRFMAFDMLNELIQEHWHSKKWRFRKSTFSFKTSQAVEEYALHKLANEIVPYTFRGSDPVRMLSFKPSHAFYREHQAELSDGDPYIYRDGEYIGVEHQVSAASQITVHSSLANVTTGTVAVVYGSTRMVLSALTLTVDDIGKWILVGSDWKRYKIVSLEPNTVGSSSIFHVHEAYDGATSATATFAIGDVQQKVVILGYDATGSSIISEELQLNGATDQVSTNLFYSLIRISKSDKTHGYISATSNGGLVTNIVLDPGEMDADFKTVKLYPIPTREELLTFESYGKHPYLYKPTDAPLFPTQSHAFLLLDLVIKLKTEFQGLDVSPVLLDRRNNMLDRMIVADNDSDEWDAKQESDTASSERSSTNLPNNFGSEDSDF